MTTSARHAKDVNPVSLPFHPRQEGEKIMTTDKSNESSKRLDEWNSRVNEFLEAVLPDGDRDSHPVPFPVEDPPVASTITKEENAPNLIETKGSPVDLISPHVGIYPQCRLVPISTAPTTTTSKSDTTKSSHVPTRSTEPTRYVSKCHGTSIRKCSLRRLSGWEKEYEDTEQEIDKEWDPNWDEFLDIKHYKSWCKNFNKHKTTTSIKCVATTATVKCTTSSSPIKCSASSVPIPTTTAIAKSSILTSTKVQTTTTEITAQPSPTSEPPKSITSTCALKRDTFCLYVSEKDGQAYFTIHAAGKGYVLY